MCWCILKSFSVILTVVLSPHTTFYKLLIQFLKWPSGIYNKTQVSPPCESETAQCGWRGECGLQSLALLRCPSLFVHRHLQHKGASVKADTHTVPPALDSASLIVFIPLLCLLFFFPAFSFYFHLSCIFLFPFFPFHIVILFIAIHCANWPKHCWNRGIHFTTAWCAAARAWVCRGCLFMCVWVVWRMEWWEPGEVETTLKPLKLSVSWFLRMVRFLCFVCRLNKAPLGCSIH